MKHILVIIFLSVISGKYYAQPQSTNSYPELIHKKRLNTTIEIGAGVYIAGLSYLNYIRYKDHERVPFHFYNDSEGYLWIDKFGHA